MLPPSLIRVRMEVPTFAVALDAVSLLGQPNEASSLVDHSQNLLNVRQTKAQKPHLIYCTKFYRLGMF